MINLIDNKNYFIYSANKETEALLGGKGKTLFELEGLGFLVPKGFVLSVAAWEASLTAEQHYCWENTQNDSEIAVLLGDVQLNSLIKQELQLALTQLCPNGELVAVRSSAIDEDGVEYSFAGQFDSFLNVPLEEVFDKITEVWHSGFSRRVLTYRRQNGLPLLPHPPAVLIQRMINPQVAGVAFGADAVTDKRGVAIVSAVSGNGSSLVSGESDADTYYIYRDETIIERQIISEQLLKDEQILEIAALVRQLGKHFARPQDIEWAIENEQLYLLQSRPITTLAQKADPDGLLNLWDNSNISESYSGVTTPLTFSFARKAYEEVYRQFCRFMGVPEATIARNHDTFPRMIGLIQGRVYYNLLSWYRVLAMLPGFRINRRFMEQMMGVREPLPESIISELQAATWQDRLKDIWRLLMTVFGLIKNYFLLPKLIKGFYLRLDRALYLQESLSDWRPEELAAYYRKIEGQLLSRWDAPLINDFFAMIFYGVLRGLTKKWCNDESGTLQNDLISGEDKIISIEPAVRMQKMAGLISGDGDFVNILCNGSAAEILSSMEKLPLFKTEYQEYIQKFGDRCLDELKLESPTLHDDPLPLLRSIGQLGNGEWGMGNGGKCRKAAEERLKEVLKWRPLRGFVFNWVLQNARKRVCERENLRFERTRVFGRARRVFVELGKRFYSLDLLESPRDIFYLEVNEILGFIEGTTTCTNLKALVGIRKTEFAEYQEITPPDSRFETHGIVNQGNSFTQSIVRKEQNELTQTKQGIGCSSGIVRGLVRVITDPKQVLGSENHLLIPSGTILVAERTDPGWILLFPAAVGLVVERGSLLSHAAIVSRELGLPAVISLSGATSWLQDGDLVEIDGGTGKVSKLEKPKSQKA
ncbi:MAG: phosphoenolpyruvate synthase [Scytonematopsis contorta HA4267-MV1]|jgi:pyruvate,water dikinase|nr:phosphoenolpyruvate synthase [Scytonematopsis contorta HA4267-MV1]